MMRSAEQELLPLVTRQLEQLEALAEVGKTVVSSLELGEVLTRVLDKLSLLLRPSHWSLLLMDEREQALYFELAVGEGAEGLIGSRVALGEGIAGWSVEHRQPVVVSDVSLDERFAPRFDQATGITTVSLLAVPLLFGDKALGVIELVSEDAARPYTREHLELLRPFADFVAIAISNARQHAEIERLTISDDCTGLYNARFLHSVLDREVKRSERYHHPVSLVFLDLDNFKRVNDSHGHLVGSALLAEVGSLLLAMLREVDVATRYGGDEFVVVLPETSRDGALLVGQRILRGIREHRFCRHHGLELAITTSVGVASFPDDATDAQALLKLADQAMYSAKAAGRDCVRGYSRELQ